MSNGILYILQRSFAERIGGLVKLAVDKGREDVVLLLQLVQLFRSERGGLQELSDPGGLLAQPIFTLLDDPLHGLDVVISLDDGLLLDARRGLGGPGELGEEGLGLFEDARSIRGRSGAEESGGEFVQSQDLARGREQSTADGSVGAAFLVQELDVVRQTSDPGRRFAR